MTAIGKDGKPIDKSYLEIGLPEEIVRDINAYLKAQKIHDSCLDCYWCELYGTINSFCVAELITKEQAAYLRKKYLKMEVEI